MEATEEQEAAALAALVEPLAYVDQIAGGYNTFRAMALGPYDLDMILKADGLPDEPALARAELLARAEQLLGVLDAAGWQITSDLSMELTAEVRPFRQTLDGQLAEPSRQKGIRLRLRLSVNRPR